MKFITYLAVFMLYVSTHAQDYNPTPQTWIIDAEQVACENNEQIQCYLVKFPGKKEFEIFNDQIEGFSFEPGYQYTVVVKQQLKTPPIKADESIFKYVLVKMNSKKAVKSEALSNAVSAISSSKSNAKTIEVNFETVPCGNGKQCLLVKEQGKKEFEIFDKSIYGFNYEAGNTYVLSVKDASDGNYFLATEIIKKKVKEINQKNEINTSNSEQSVQNKGKVTISTGTIYNSGLDGRWYLRKMKEDETASFTTEDNVIYIDINTFADKISGFASCNVFEGILRSDNQTTFLLDGINQNFKSCGYIKLENMFLNRLKEVNKFERKGNTLILSKDWKYVMEFSSDNTLPTPKKYEPVVITETNIKESSSTYTTTVTPSNITPVMPKQDSDELLKAQQEKEKKEKELAELKKQIEQKNKDESAKLKKLEEENLQKQKEIDAMKKQLETPVVTEQKHTKSTSETVETKKASKEMDADENKPSDEENAELKKKKVNDYVITTFVKNASLKDIPEPEFPNRPYYLDGNELVKLERAEANFAAKAKGIYRGVDFQVQVMKEESPIQFLKTNLPRFFIQITDEDIDPYDVIDLCKADRIGKGRRNFTYAGKKYGGRVKDVTGKLVQLEFKKISKGVYEIIIEGDIQQGEYAFLPIVKTDNSLSSTNSIKANCFGIVDPE